MSTYNKEKANFEEIEHTADVGIKSCASSLPELFTNVAFGMYQIVFGSLTMNPEESRCLRLSATSYEDLLVTWLSELNYLLLVHHFVASTFSSITIAKKNSMYSIEADLTGEDIKKHHKQIKTEIKAVTYHQLYCKKSGKDYCAQVIFDI